MGKEMKSYMEEALPFAAMVMVECGEVGMITLGKAAMNNGLSNLVYVVYYNALGTVLLLPYFIFHSYRSDQRPPLTLSVLCRCFGLGLIGICFLQVFAYAGINYSSPTLAAALGNLIPAFTFLLAIIFRMEPFDLRRSTSQVKSLGTLVAISGAFVMTLYKGPAIWTAFSDDSPQRLLLSQESNWILGGLFLSLTCIFSSSWNIFQTATIKEYPDKMTVVFYYCCFGTIQSAILTLVIERNLSAWVLSSGIELIAVVFAAIFGTAVRSTVLTWCLQKRGPVFVAMFKPISVVIAVIMGMLFLAETLYLGSVIGAAIIVAGFYTVMWGKSKEDTKHEVICGLESQNENTPLLK